MQIETISQQALSKKKINEVLRQVSEKHIPTLSKEEYVEAIRLSRLYKVSVYDASYIVLASSLNGDLKTLKTEEDRSDDM